LNVQVAGNGTSLKMSSFTPSAGSALDLDLNASGNPTAPIINVTGALTPAATVTINVGGVLSGAGQFSRSSSMVRSVARVLELLR